MKNNKNKLIEKDGINMKDKKFVEFNDNLVYLYTDHSNNTYWVYHPKFGEVYLLVLGLDYLHYKGSDNYEYTSVTKYSIPDHYSYGTLYDLILANEFGESFLYRIFDYDIVDCSDIFNESVSKEFLYRQKIVNSDSIYEIYEYENDGYDSEYFTLTEIINTYIDDSEVFSIKHYLEYIKNELKDKKND